MKENKRTYGDPRLSCVLSAMGWQGEEMPVAADKDSLLEQVWTTDWTNCDCLPDYANNIPKENLPGWAANILTIYFNARRING